MNMITNSIYTTTEKAYLEFVLQHEFPERNVVLSRLLVEIVKLPFQPWKGSFVPHCVIRIRTFQTGPASLRRNRIPCHICLPAF